MKASRMSSTSQLSTPTQEQSKLNVTQSAPTIPKWKAQLRERNRLAAPPLHRFNSVTSSTDSRNGVVQEHSPLFDSMSSIQYEDDDDDLAAQIYGKASPGSSTSSRRSLESRMNLKSRPPVSPDSSRTSLESRMKLKSRPSASIPKQVTQSAPAGRPKPIPKWKEELKERNRLAAPPLHKFNSERSLTSKEDISAKEKELEDDYNPLFESLTSIEYKDDEDDLAARMYGATLESVQKNSPNPYVTTEPEDNSTSGYDFDALIDD